MRLLSCYIAGFGKFADRSFDLSQNPVVIKAENGWGKTTLAAFIECMLFGMDNGRTKSVAGNDRIKYEPFTGGAYGGALVLSAGGQVYRIERTFAKTPVGDTLKVYDGNNMPVTAFAGGVSVGEALLSISRESFKRSAYIPQERRIETGLPDDMKSRLLSLLTAEETSGGAGAAIERLDTAERALRAKRKPAKGKLDILDERLLSLAREKDECLAAKDEAAALKLRIDERSERLLAIGTRLQSLTGKLERSARAEERRAAASAQKELYLHAERAKTDKARLAEFFNGNDPHSVNTDGLASAVTEFYAIKEELTNAEAGADGRQAESLRIQLAALEKTIASYEAALGAEREAERQNGRLKKEKRAGGGKKRKRSLPIVIVALLLTLVGAANLSANPALGYILFFVGLAGLAFGLGRMLKSVPFTARRSRVTGVAEEYEKAVAEAEAVKAELARLQNGGGVSPEALAAKRERAQTLEAAIDRFLSNFRFPETIYDYRAAMQTLRENIARFDECERVLATGVLPAPTAEEAPIEDAETLKREIRALEKEKETLTAERARLCENREEKEKRAFAFYDLQAAETGLNEEKARLERRLAAIRAAREALLRARENMASRYLVPVQKLCREYLRIMGYAESEKLRFAADGAPLLDERGGMKELAYYSAGVKELIGLCMRLALCRLVFRKELPPLILDDPFVDLDDDKTERAKTLLKELSKEYQIVYFTCKEERRL